MNKYLVVDYKIAARYRSNIFGKNFKWPVNHSFYDDTYKNFYDWIYDFPSIIGKNEKLKLIFELVELDLLEYLGNIFGALVDVHLSKKEKLKSCESEIDNANDMKAILIFPGVCKDIYSVFSENKSKPELIFHNPDDITIRVVEYLKELSN